MTSATEELRRLLDERGVEWTYADGTVSFASNGRWYHAWAYSDDSMCVSMGYLTPEQAIAATLGGGECEMRADGSHCMNGVEFYECRSCGEYACVPTETGKSEPPNFCPNCGARIEVSDK